MQKANEKIHLNPYVSPLGAWALALGTSIGWGSVVVTSNSYLAQAGPWGSVIGIILGGLIMLIISRNYHYLINCFPDAGGAYLYSREAFGYDHGFLTAWFLSLTYLAILWANATSLPLFAHYFFGDIFKFGFHYHIFGYDIFLGEALLSVASIFIIAFLCITSKKATIWIMILMVLIFTVGIAICFASSLIGHSIQHFSFDPGFLPGKSELSQIILIASISPWAFIGFENISHSAEEFTFRHKYTFRILVAAVFSSIILYIFVMLLSVTAYPSEYSSWFAYIKDLPNISGYKGLPAFYTAHYYLGNTGLYILMYALFALIVSSLIGNITALSRLFFALSKDGVIPRRFKEINKASVPAKAVMLIAVCSIPMPFLGRTAISWIVDVTTIGATIVYGIVSASALKTASLRSDKVEKASGLAGTILMVMFGAYLLLPNLVSKPNMAQETFLLFTVWGTLGLIYFRSVMKRDSEWHFGRSIIVWIVLLMLMLLISLIWMNQSMHSYTEKSMAAIHNHFIEHGSTYAHQREDELFIKGQLDSIQLSHLKSELMVIGMFLVSMLILLANYSLMRKRAEKSRVDLLTVRDIAMKDPLTRVNSKHAFQEKERRLNAAIRDKALSELAVVVCDINDLKYINDKYGHTFGDKYICSSCSIICNCYDHSPVYRVGGDEFAVVLTGRDFFERHEKLSYMHNTSEENVFAGREVIASGMADFDPSKDTCLEDIFKRADDLMYKNKKELKRLQAMPDVEKLRKLNT